MARKYQKWFGKRALLNLPGFHSTSAIVAEVEDTQGLARGNNHLHQPEVNFQIADCDRVVKLEIDFSSPEERVNSLYKIDTMIDVLTDFRKGVVIEQNRYEKKHGKNRRGLY